MLKNYMKRSAMLLGAAAVAASAYAGAYVDVTRQYLQDPTFIPGWQGYIAAVDHGVAEVWCGAFKAYQNLGEQPAGHYVLTANALYRCGGNNYSIEHQDGNADLNTAYIFINDKKEPVTGLTAELKARPGDGEAFDPAKHFPNGLEEANKSFAAGKYANKVEFDHQGGELIIGICNTGCYYDEWCAFDNFKLTKDGAEVTENGIVNGDFSTGIDFKRSWDNVSTENKEKTPDINRKGGNYRKCGGSPYKTAQQVELPAGKYYFSMLCFHRYGSTVDENGVQYDHKWPGAAKPGYGCMSRSPKDWFEAKDYDEVGEDRYQHAYIFMSKNETCPKDLGYEDVDMGDLKDNVDVRTRVKDCWEICNGDLSIMPDNNPREALEEYHNAGKPDQLQYTVKNKCTTADDSGSERESSAAFVNEGEKWRQGVEFTLDAPTKVWIGLGKNQNTGDGYWHAYTDIKLQKWDDNAQSGVDNIALDTEIDENAPVEYFNMQGVRVAEPTTGLYIVRQGNKVSKQLIRK